MGIDLIPQSILDRYTVEERRHACAILATDFREEFKDITECLDQFKLARSEILVGGGGKSKIASRFDGFLLGRGWREMRRKVSRRINGDEAAAETHKVDFCKRQIAVEVEWNNKDPFYSRDLAAFRMLHDLGVISVGVIITRLDELQEVFDMLGKKIGAKYGASTTHWSKLMPRVEAGEAGTCPLLLVGISERCYVLD